jgi:hypothetical protein
MSCQQIGSEYQMSAIGVNLALLLAVLFLWGFIQLVLCAKLRTLSNFLSFAQMASVILTIGAKWPESVSGIVGRSESAGLRCRRCQPRLCRQLVLAHRFRRADSLPSALYGHLLRKGWLRHCFEPSETPAEILDGDS